MFGASIVKEARQSPLLPIDLVVLANLISEKVWEIHMRRSEIASCGRESNFRTCGKTQIASNLCLSGNEDIGLHASSYPGRCDSQNRILKAVIHSNRPIAVLIDLLLTVSKTVFVSVCTSPIVIGFGESAQPMVFYFATAVVV
jgi:hypothetical protein